MPWSWCQTEFKTNINNSICIFAPSDDTLHAVKLRYDHLKFQRTQVYGNLWFDDDRVKYALEYRDIDLLSRREAMRPPGPLRRLASRGKRMVKNLVS